jgi:hypothetical protein
MDEMFFLRNKELDMLLGLLKRENSEIFLFETPADFAAWIFSIVSQEIISTISL